MPRDESLLDASKRLLRKTMTDLTLREIARRAGVGFEWLRSFSKDRFENPGINDVQRLYDFCALYQQAKKNGSPANEERAPAA